MASAPDSAGPTDRVVVVGAGLAGLSAAVRLVGAGRRVRVLDRASGPGGLMGRWEADGYRFDTGPTVLTMPSLIDDVLHCVGESLGDRLELHPLAPSYTAHFADGSVLRSFSDEDRMADEVARVCGPAECANYRRLVRYLTALYDAEFAAFMDRNLDAPKDLLRREALRILRLGGLRSMDHAVRRHITDPRLARLFTFQALYAGVSPWQARAIYSVIGYLDSVAGTWFPRGGMHEVARALAGAAADHGAQLSYGTTADRIEIISGRATAVLTTDGERIPADVVILACDPRVAYRSLLPDSVRDRSARRVSRAPSSPSAVVWHVGSSAPLPHPAHHSISFGRGWRETFRDITGRGQLMSDPSLLITSPTVTDPGSAPDGRHGYYVLAPAPNTARGEIDWERIGPRYRDEIAAVLERRGFDVAGAFSSGVEVERLVTPLDWERAGYESGSPFGIAHTVTQTGPLRHPTRSRSIGNLLFCGANVQPGIGIPTVLLSGRLAAQRITG